MIKQAPRPLQMFAMVAFVMCCVGVLLYLWLSFGGVVPLRSQGYQVKIRFPEATQLAEQADVRIAGVPVGTVTKIEIGPNNTTEATLEMRSRYAPVARDARALLRQKSLLGETYIDLAPGDSSNGTIDDGGVLAQSRVAPTVELDEIFRTFDEDTREAFQVWMQSQAASVNGRGADVNAMFGTLPGFVEAGDDLLAELDAQSRALSETVRGTGQLFSALSERDGQLARLITASNQVFQTTAARNRDFAAIWEELPRFARESRLTLPRLTQLAQNARPVVRQLMPAASELSATFQRLEQISPEFESFFRGLGPLITASQKGTPAFERLFRRFPGVLDDLEPFMQNLNPILAYIGQNRREVAAFFANTTAATQARNNELPIRHDFEPPHFLRATATLTPQGLGYFPRKLGLTRTNAYMAPGGLDRLASGLGVFDTGTCGNADPDPPTSADPPALVPLTQMYVFRAPDGERVARPPCVAQGDFPGFDTQFPQLEPEP